jgi:hypothetical protein
LTALNSWHSKEATAPVSFVKVITIGVAGPAAAGGPDVMLTVGPSVSTYTCPAYENFLGPVQARTI